MPPEQKRRAVEAYLDPENKQGLRKIATEYGLSRCTLRKAIHNFAATGDAAGDAAKASSQRSVLIGPTEDTVWKISRL